MKFTYDWLKEYVDLPWSPQELADRLTFAGIEVESVETYGGEAAEQVVVCQVLSSDKHPNADKLSVCRVTDGTAERQIVCGARNYQVGDKVPLAVPGVTLPGNFTIKPAKLRGVESQGMMCSAEELGLPKGEDGLLILPADTPVGIKLSEALGGSDTLYDIEVTPNRPDWLAVIGIAREVAALTGNALRLPELTISESDEKVENIASVEVAAPDFCPRYTARVIRGVKIGPSPAWLRQKLERVGMRPINNVVDVTNFVLMESGHPLHAFDYNLVAEHKIVVRRAQNGELFEAIDDSRHELTDEMLVIADAERAVALAGVMGGKNSEINGSTTDVLLESAYFFPSNIRRTSKRLGLASESSYRFERGTDLEGLVWASNRATALIQQLAGGQVARGMIDALAKPITRRCVSCRYAQVNRLLGIEVPVETVKKIFVGLGLAITKEEPAGCEVEVPSFRVDLEREADLMEEVCRIHGVEKIPAQMLPATAQVSAFDAQWDARARVREILTSLGFHEAMNQTMVQTGRLKIQNPLTSEMSTLRETLLPGLLTNLRTNVSRHQYDVWLFEIGRVFAGDGRESLHLALAMTGRRDPQSWETTVRESKLDYYDLKGVLEELAVQMGAPGIAATPIKELPASAARKMDLRDAVFTTEFDLNAGLAAARAEQEFSELPKFPAVVRDMALVLDEGVSHGEIVAVIEGHRNKFLEQVQLFDIFRGSPVAPGKKSMAYSLTFRAAERTLTDAEVNAAHEQLKRKLQEALKCEIREG